MSPGLEVDSRLGLARQGSARRGKARRNMRTVKRTTRPLGGEVKADETNPEKTSERREVERTLSDYAYDVLEAHYDEAPRKTANLVLFLLPKLSDELLAEAQAHLAELRQRKVK